jgi:mRNA-degrading endonuclease YafQ of YafQ-DinJ toxin-antitoxin module
MYPTIFIPDIMGTSLVDHYPVDHRVIYNALTDKFISDFEMLMLDDEGRFDRELDRLIYGSELVSAVYGEFIAELRENLPLDEKKIDHAKVYPFPYDWRRSIASNALMLGSFIDLIIAKSNAHPMYIKRNIKIDKVNLVGHSMGGCIAKHYVTNCDGEHKTNKLIMLASPLRGSLDALKHLVMGETWFFGIFTRKGKRHAVRTLPGVYDLLPFDGHFTKTNKIEWPSGAAIENGLPVNIFDVNNWQPSVGKQIGTNTLELHLNNSFSFFEKSNNFSDKFKNNCLMVYGVGKKTLRQVVIYRNKNKDVEINFDENTQPPASINGDGTVPAISTYSEGIHCVEVTKEKAGDWELDLGKIAGFHASFCCYDLIQDIVISFLTGKIIKSVRNLYHIDNIRDIRKFNIDLTEKKIIW